MAKRRSKTNDKLLSLSEDEKNYIGREVERLMKNEMSYICNKYIHKYKKVAFDTFGWEIEDLEQHIRILLWKGVATFDPERKFKITTYLTSILYYQMGNFSKTCQTKKNSLSKLYCPEILYDCDETTDFNDSPKWVEYQQSFSVLSDNMSKLETKILVMHLVNGESLSHMQNKLKIKRPQLVKSLKTLKEKMDIYLRS